MLDQILFVFDEVRAEVAFENRLGGGLVLLQMFNEVFLIVGLEGAFCAIVAVSFGVRNSGRIRLGFHCGDHFYYSVVFQSAMSLK